MKNAEAAISSCRGGVKSLRNGLKNFRTGGGGSFAGGSVPHYMPWHICAKVWFVIVKNRQTFTN